MNKRLLIVVEGQSEQEFVREMIAPYLANYGIMDVRPVLIHTSCNGRGGFVNYNHLRNDIKRLLQSGKTDFVVTMFVDFFRCPDLPHKEQYENISDHRQRVEAMEQCIAEDIDDRRFLPYIQLHEFEALIFSSNKGFEEYFNKEQRKLAVDVTNEFPNPEDINTSPQGAPSKRLIQIKKDYDKVVEGNLMAIEIGIADMLDKCPRFKGWMNRIIAMCEKSE